MASRPGLPQIILEMAHVGQSLSKLSNTELMLGISLIGNLSVDPTEELNGKPIVPGLLFAGSQITTPATNRTVFQPPAVPSISLRNVVVPDGYAGLDTICDTVDTNQHEVPQQKQVSVDQEIVEASSDVNMFSVVKRSRSRQRHIEDRSREKGQATNSETSDVMQDRMQRSELATAGSNKTTASLSSKPCGDGENNAGTMASLPGQEKGFYANQDRSTEFVKCSKDGDLGNQGVQLDCSQNQIVSYDNNVKVSVRSSFEVQVTSSVCHALPETYLSVEPKKLQFDGVESVCMNSASEQTMQQPVCALEGANLDLAEAHPLNEDPSSTSYSQVPRFMGRLLLDGVESGYLNPDSAPVKQQQKSALECAILDLTGVHSGKEDQSPTTFLEVPNPTSILLVERDTLHTAEDTERLTRPDSSSDRIITRSSVSFEQQCSDSHVSHPPYSKTLQSPTQLGDTIFGAPASSQILPDSLLEEADSEDLPHSPVIEVDNQCSQLESAECPEQLQLQTVEDTERIMRPDSSSDQIITRSSVSSEQQFSDSHVSHPPYSDTLQSPTPLADTSFGVPASSQILPDSLLEEADIEDLSHSPVNDVDNECSHLESAECPEQVQPQTIEDAERMTRPDSSSDRIITRSSVSFEQQCSDSHVSHSPYSETLQSPTQLADTSFGAHASSQILLDNLLEKADSEDLSHLPVNNVDNHCSQLESAECPEQLQPQSSPLGDAYKTSLSPYEIQSNDTHSNGCAVVNVSVSEENHLSQEQHLLARTSLEFKETDVETPFGPASPVTQNETLNGKDAVNCHSGKLGDVQYFLRSAASHEKINLLKSDRSSAACDQKRSVQDGVKVNDSLSSKRRRIRRRSDFDLSRTPCTNSLSLNQQVDIAGPMLTATNFSEKSHPSSPYFSRSSGSCKSMSLVSEGGNVASDVYGNGNSSWGRRNATSLLNVVLDNSPTASTSRSALEGRIFKTSQEQKQNKLEVDFLTTTAALPYCSGILSHNEENCTQQEGTCLEGQDLNVTAASVADQEMALETDNLSSPIAILNQENYSGTEPFTQFPSYALDQHGEQASAPNALFHGKLCYGSNVKRGRIYKSYDPKGHLLPGAAISMPVFERFDVPGQFDSPIIGKRSFESLHDSCQLGTISSGPPNKYNTNTASSLHQLLTTMSPRNSRSVMGSFGYGSELDSFFISDDVASCSSNASSRQEINETPLTPSVEKYSLQKISSRCGSGSEHMGSIPELKIFRIDEDNSILEEDEYQDMAPGSVDVNYSCQRSSERTALQDITGLCQNNGNSPSLSMRCMDKGNSIGLSAESVSRDLTHHSNIKNDSIKRKYNHPTSVKREGKASRSLHGRLGTTEIISSTNGRHRSEANVEKQGTAELKSRNGRHRSEANVDRQSKPSNIVANVTSFVPLVKQKLQSTTVCVKKDVKVKALKAAEAAKRLEEKKQKEQEKRKAAAKAERERLKQEKELKQKLEEEQKKKREVDAAAKKRQREEGEKRETMKKRKCMDEARKQQKQPMDKQRGMKDEKDARQKASDNMEPRKNLVDVGKSQVRSDEATEHALRYKANERKDEKGVAVDDRNASFGSDAKENTLNSLEESYTMTPYKDSDDEDDDDYDEHEQEARRRRKFVPSWARKENLDNILLSNKTLDPREIFARKLSFNIPEVLSAPVPQRGLR
uniref:Inner centromere protein ARK-binding domain-containing protein n=1 Tax=Aegilops tauschii TaxID=37682 RepID=M8D9L4_AEGTA